MNPRQSQLLVAIVGGSGSGKTWLADKLQSVLGDQAARLSLDDFYRDQSHIPFAQREKINFDDPQAIDFESLELVLESFVAGEPAKVPCYDFETHCRAQNLRTLEPKPILLIDGLWLLHPPELRKRFGLKIFVECPPQTRLRRRLERDAISRGRTQASVRRQFHETVEPMHQRFVAPQKRWADLVLPHNLEPGEILRIAEKLRPLLSAGPVVPAHSK